MTLAFERPAHHDAIPPPPTLREKHAKGWGTPCVVGTSEVKSQGHPVDIRTLTTENVCEGLLWDLDPRNGIDVFVL